MRASTGTKRTRTEQPDNIQVQAKSTGHDELLITCLKMQTRVWQKYWQKYWQTG
jgi:hypothetical protein